MEVYNNLFRFRFCVACRRLVSRCRLVRIIRDYNYGIVLDHGIGRSAYLCYHHTCIMEAYHRKRLQRSLRCQIPDSLYSTLEQRLQRNCCRL
uniref:YlxR domain-containing protein n=1 Tax=Paulinella longichromatophora TaxID=1708747 RepID=A0A2H4ZNX8_9EUKA|nr:hypothetical protein PLO_253 [Paulinella longichromatophora]